MVSIVDKINYLNRISDSPKLVAFNQLLVGEAIAQSHGNELGETDEIYFGIISAIQSNDKISFVKYYSKKSKSNPSKESPTPFVNDDFLIFSIILGVSKFNIDKSWIKSIVGIRSRTSITITLDNLIEENYTSTSNLPETVLMFLQLINQNLITNDFLNVTFKKINQNTNLFEGKSDFQILCAIHAYNSIILLKEAPKGSEVNLLRLFNTKFLKRIKVFSWVIQSIILIAIFYEGFEVVSKYPTAKEFIDRIGSVLKVLGIIGLSQIGNLFPVVKRKSYELMLKIFGYPKDLIENLNKKEQE